MPKVGQAVALLRALLVLLFLGIGLAQVVILPGWSAHLAQELPELAYLRWPLLICAIVELACIQVVIVCIWRLLGMVRVGQIFSSEAFGWVDAIVWVMGVAWMLLFGVFVTLLALVPEPGTLVLAFGAVLVGGVLVLLMVVMRTLLRQATTLRAEMEAVI